MLGTMGVSCGTLSMQRTAKSSTPPKTEQRDESFVVVYAKMVDDKDDGIYLAGVYYGGVGTSHQEAEQAARECVNQGKGGTILPKIIPTTGTVLDAMNLATARFRRMESDMLQVEEIITRNSPKR